ncbi:MAG: acyl-CoA dehydrogenase, partial [Comamonadaceae bacterium]|nr:acyl-CoA dehydrogenase [Comamonadaceae bacterium]
MHPHDPIAAALDHCLSAPTTVPPLDSVDQWWPGWAALAAQPSSPMALALLGGFAADRVGWAFAAGYQSALRTLVPSLPVQALAAFCVTEEGGNRPRDIRTLITLAPAAGSTVSGAGRWTTLGPRAPCCWSLAGLRARPLTNGPASRWLWCGPISRASRSCRCPETAFVPEVPHARIQLQDVAIEASSLLPGDGYDT